MNSDENNNQNMIKTIGNYTLCNTLLGKGSFGKVLLSYDNNKKLCATKIMPSSQVGPENKKHLLNEVNIVSKIKHKNIIKLYYCTKTKNTFYLMLEYANRGDIATYIKNYRQKYKSTLPEDKIQFIIKQVVEGIHYMHDHDIIHRDIKLNNIFLHDIN